MAETIYILASLMCLLCTVQLLRRWKATGVQLLFWSAICFLTLTAANVLLFVDRVMVPLVDLTIYRNVVTLSAIVFMLYGLIMGGKSR